MVYSNHCGTQHCPSLTLSVRLERAESVLKDALALPEFSWPTHLGLTQQKSDQFISRNNQNGTLTIQDGAPQI